MLKINIKRVIVIIGVICCVTVIYAEGVVCDITYNVSGGKIIKTGANVGLTGYDKVEHSYSNEVIKGVRYVISSTNCSGKGTNICPSRPECPSTSISPAIYDEIIGKLQSDIDLGHIAGNFVIGEFVCTWEEGSKEIEVVNGIEYPIYSYNLKITSMNPEIIENLEIQVVPNPVHNSAMVHFSMPINAMMNVKVVDAMGYVHWVANVDVTSDVLVLPEAVINTLQAGTYYVVCTNNDYTAYAPFIKQ
jgi:hypothetical protein